MSDAIKQSLARRGIRLVCHMTPCHRLPDIFRTAALLCQRERTAQGIVETDDHYWGSADKQEALRDFVICSFMPPWWMCRRHNEELAIIVLDAVVCALDGVCFCPINSAYSTYPAEEIKHRQGIDAFDACFQNPDSYQAGDAEIFVPTRIGLADFRGLVICDDVARDYWVPKLREALGLVPNSTPLPPDAIKVAVGRGMGFRFPGDFQPTERVRG